MFRGVHNTPIKHMMRGVMHRLQEHASEERQEMKRSRDSPDIIALSNADLGFLPEFFNGLSKRRRLCTESKPVLMSLGAG